MFVSKVESGDLDRSSLICSLVKTRMLLRDSKLPVKSDTEAFSTGIPVNKIGNLRLVITRSSQEHVVAALNGPDTMAMERRCRVSVFLVHSHAHYTYDMEPCQFTL